MTDSIRTKDELLALMADNSTGDISPQDLRDFVVSNNVKQVQEDSAPAVLVADTDLFLAAPGCSTLELTTIAAYGNRALEVVNASGGDLVITPAGGETIEFAGSLTLADQAYISLAPVTSSTNWVTLLRTDTQESPDDFAIGYFNESVAITNIVGTLYVDINETMLQGPKSANFLVIGDELIYSGEDKTFAVDVSVSAKKNSGSEEAYTFALSKNGTPQAPTMGVSLSNGTLTPLPLQTVVSLSDGDTLKAQVRGDITSDDIVVSDLSIRTTEIRT